LVQSDHVLEYVRRYARLKTAKRQPQRPSMKRDAPSSSLIKPMDVCKYVADAALSTAVLQIELHVLTITATSVCFARLDSTNF